MLESIGELANDAVEQLHGSDRGRYLLGVTGPPGAGKSTLVEALIRACSKSIGAQHVIGLPMDGFHLTTEQLNQAGLQNRKGAPETFDADGFVSALRRLAKPDVSVLTWPRYSRELHEPIADAISVPPTVRLVFVEGNYLLLKESPWKLSREFLDSVWYVAADMSTIQTRLQRRQVEGGRDAADADQHVLQSDLVNAARVEETRELADRIVQIDPSDPELENLSDPATGRPIALE